MILDFGMRISDWKNRSDAKHRLRPDFVDGPKLVSKKPCKQFKSHFRRHLKSALRKLQSAILAGAIIFAFSYSASAQQPKKIYRIGYLSLGLGIQPGEEAFRQGLRELGYIDGQNIVVEWRFAKGKADLLPELAAELVRLKVDIIIASATLAIQAAKQATQTIPIVFPRAGDPVAYGLIDSLARPGGNITGVSNLSLDLSGKRLELLKEALPRISRVAVLYDPQVPLALKQTQAAAQLLGLKIQALEVRAPADIESAFSAVRRERTDSLITMPTPGISVHQKRVLDLTEKNRLPAMHSSKTWVEAGGLMSYGVDVLDNDRRAAILVDKILKGAKPADLPVEQPKKFEFVINLKAAKQIGLTIPPNVLARADRVIK
jgi:putative ABC transport system substrate-binding protein